MFDTANVLSILGNVYLVVPFAFDWRWALSVWLSVILTEVIKAVTRDMPYTCLKRPSGARGCDALGRGGAVGGAPGFPSGHTTIAAAFWMGAWLLAPSEWRPWIFGMGALAVGAMGWSRVAKECHTWLQVVAGAMFGAAVSYMCIL